MFLFIRHTNKGHIFCVCGLVLATSSRKNRNKTILCNSKITPLSTPLLSTSLPVGAILKEPALRTTRNPLGRSQWGEGWVGGWAVLLSHRPHSFRFKKKKIDLLLHQLKFEKTDNVFIKSIHSGLWQNFLSLLAQMVVEQEAGKLFS